MMEPRLDSPGRTSRKDVRRYFIAIICMGLAGAMVDSSFNNYLKSNWDIGGLARSSLELPREIPGFLNVFVAAALAFLPGRRIGAIAFFLQALGIAFLGSLSPNFRIMTGWLFLYSLGQHVFLPFQQSIGMELAKSGGEGALLGRANALKNMAQLVGGAIVFIGFSALGITFKTNYLMTAFFLLCGSLALASMTVPQRDKAPTRLVFKKRYSLFYVLSVLYGTRKQLFITFAPWVIVSIYGKSTSVVAGLYFLGGLAGVVFQPLIGKAVDHLGERFMLGLEALILIPVCGFYGLAHYIFPEAIAFIVVSLCYIVDSLLLSFGMARSIWMKKSAETSADIAPTLAMGISIDHIFSIIIALGAGLVWDRFGYKWVFLAGSIIAIVNFVATRFMRAPSTSSNSIGTMN